MKNQAKAMWSRDFFVQHTVGFQILYVFFVMEIARCVLTEFIAWYHHGHVHQALNGIPDPDPVSAEPKPAGGRLVAIPVLNGLHHDYRLAA